MQNNRLTVTRGAGELVLAPTHSPWRRWRLSCCYGPRWWHGYIRVAGLLDMALWSTWWSLHPDGDVGRYCPISQCHMRRMWGHHMLTAAFEPTHTIHTLRHSVVHCRQGQHANAENTEGLGFPGLFEKKIWFAAFHTNILNWTRFSWREIIKFVGGRDMMAWAMELLDGCPTAPRWTVPDCRRHTLLPQPVEYPRKAHSFSVFQGWMWWSQHQLAGTYRDR